MSLPLFSGETHIYRRCQALALPSAWIPLGPDFHLTAGDLESAVVAFWAASHYSE